MKFPIDWDIPYNTLHLRSGINTTKLTLNDEWSLACVFGINGYGCWTARSLQVHRVITTREFAVYGSLRLVEDGKLKSEQKICQLISPGSSSKEICSYSNCSHSQYSLHGFLIISCSDEDNLADKNSTKDIQLNSLVELSNDFERLLDPKTSSFADVNLKCDSGAIIPAHKIILSARSPVFAAMFANTMKESIENVVHISDIEESVLRSMVAYMYTGKTALVTAESASGLLFAADKYQLSDLKKVCCDFLKTTVSQENALKILVMGDLYADDLKSFAVDYLCKKCTEFYLLEKTEEWITLKRERPDLVIEVFTSFVKFHEEKLKR